MKHFTHLAGKLAIILSFSVFLGACSTMKTVLPSHRAELNTFVSKNANTNKQMGASPLYVVIYQLTAPTVFSNLGFFVLEDGNIAKHGPSFIAVNKYYLLPNKKRQIVLNIQKNTKYLGVFADYHRMQQTTWKKVIPLNDSWGEEVFNLNFNEHGISIQ